MRVRIVVWVIVILQLLIPTVLLVVRWQDPSLGQLPFGWQMHTSCWGAEEPCG